ncbi:unnamed protein product [Clavelina lepadiformis]|uniref:Exostosin GT47 domain-containing protein n=1 Tax=Clavelina lepadiformis TaxID=159417 RepID=A0ABP0F6H8_CLALP
MNYGHKVDMNISKAKVLWSTVLPCIGIAALVMCLLQKVISCGNEEQQCKIQYEYEFLKQKDVDGKDFIHVQAHDLETVKRVCDSFEECEAFNSNGWLKTSSSFYTTNQADLYIKQKSKKSRNSVFAPFTSEYTKMMIGMKIYVYETSIGIAHRPHRTGGYAVERVFVELLLKSPFITHNPNEATFFFIPIRCSSYILDASTEHDGILEAKRIVGEIMNQIQNLHPFWSWSNGADHFYICAHDIGSGIGEDLLKNSIALVNTADYEDQYFIPNKDISLPPALSPDLRSLSRDMAGAYITPSARNILAFYAGDVTSGRIRPSAYRRWLNDEDIVIFDHLLPTNSYKKYLMKSRFCLILRGREVWSSRITEAILCGCVPVILSDHYHLPLQGIVNWKDFSIILPEKEVFNLKAILQSVTPGMLTEMQFQLKNIYHHFVWNNPAQPNDAFYSVMLQLWQKRHIVRYQPFNVL